VRFVQADVSRAADVDQLVSSTVRAYGRLDAAFNNAATADGALALTADFTEEQFDRALALNLKSVWLCLRAEIRQMLCQDPPGGGIRVNALVAGAFRTPMLEHVIAEAGGGTPEGSAAVEAQYNTLIPMRRIGRPEEAAEVAVWLCSDAASYVTGHSMIVDGGMTAATR
jgi:NAD(P)-dependent dehydrogenase (short-subunit alcohol dehydrogenase family)